MRTGLLWFDDRRDRPLAVKVIEAAKRYAEKFGVAPDVCYVNPALLGQEEQLVVSLPAGDGVALRLVPAPNILPHHFLVGVAEAQPTVGRD